MTNKNNPLPRVNTPLFSPEDPEFGFSSGTSGPSRRRFLKRTGGATVSAFLTWQQSTTSARALDFSTFLSDMFDEPEPDPQITAAGFHCTEPVPLDPVDGNWSHVEAETHDESNPFRLYDESGKYYDFQWKAVKEFKCNHAKEHYEGGEDDKEVTRTCFVLEYKYKLALELINSDASNSVQEDYAEVTHSHHLRRFVSLALVSEEIDDVPTNAIQHTVGNEKSITPGGIEFDWKWTIIQSTPSPQKTIEANVKVSPSLVSNAAKVVVKKFLKETHNNNNSSFDPDMTAFTSPPTSDDDSRVFKFVVGFSTDAVDRGSCKILLDTWKQEFGDDEEVN